MNELVQIAQNVTKAVSHSIPFSISLSNEDGYIIGASDSKRIGLFHPDFKKVVNSGEFVIFSEKHVMGMENVLPGIAVPLVFDARIIGVLGIIGSPDTVKPYADLIKNYVELMWQELYYKQIEELETKIEETYLQYILLSEYTNETRIAEYSRKLGISMKENLFCIVIDIKDNLVKGTSNHKFSLTINNLKDLILQEIKKAYTGNKIKKVSFFNTDKIVLILSISSLDKYFSFMDSFKEKSEQLMKLFRNLEFTEVYIAAGKLTDSVYTLNSSYQEALYLLDKYDPEYNEQKIMSLHDWEVLIELLPFNLDPTFMQRVIFELSQLISHNQFRDLKESFLAYCENNMNVTKASASLYIHRNTLTYRLKKIEQLTSIDTKKFPHCSLLYFVFCSKDFEIFLNQNCT